VKDDSDRSVGEEPWALSDGAVKVLQPPRIPGAQALVVEPYGQLVQCRGPGQVLLYDLRRLAELARIRCASISAQDRFGTVTDSVGEPL